MKTLKLILFNTKKLFFESKSMFFFIMIGIIFAVFGIFFYSGYFMNNYYNTTFINELEISLSEKSDVNKLLDLSNKIEEEKGFVRIIASNGQEYEDTVDVVGMYEKNLKEHLFCGEGYFLHEETPCAVLSEYSMEILGYKRNIIGESIKKDNYFFKICGIHRSAFGLCVPMDFYINNYPVKKLYAEFDCPISDDLISILESDNYEYLLMQNESPFDSTEFLTSFFMIIAIFCISFINILMVFSLWETKMKPSFRIYYIYGCSKIQKFFIVSGEFFIVSIFGMLLGIVLFLLLYETLGKLFVIYTGNYTNYIFIAIFVLFILLLFSIYFGYKNMIRQQKLFLMKE